MKTSVVAGANGTLGLEIVKRLLTKKTGKVLGICQTKSQCDHVREVLQTSGFDDVALKSLQLNFGNLTGLPEMNSLIHQSLPWLGFIDSFFHAVGAYRYGLTVDAKEADYDLLFDANLKSSWVMAKALLPLMIKQNTGTMMFTSSYSTLQSFGMGNPGSALYTASKAALNALIVSMQQEVKTTDICINAVLPTIIDNPANRSDMPSAPFNHWVNPTELADLMIDIGHSSPCLLRGALISVPGKV